MGSASEIDPTSKLYNIVSNIKIDLKYISMFFEGVNRVKNLVHKSLHTKVTDREGLQGKIARFFLSPQRKKNITTTIEPTQTNSV